MKIVPLMSAKNQALLGECVRRFLSPELQAFAATRVFHLHGYGELIVVGHRQALQKMQQFLEGLDSYEIELEDQEETEEGGIE